MYLATFECLQEIQNSEHLKRIKALEQWLYFAVRCLLSGLQSGYKVWVCVYEILKCEVHVKPTEQTSVLNSL